MGLISSLFRTERRDLNEVNAWQLLTQSLRGGDVGPVTPNSAMQIATVFACVRVLSESIAKLPLRLMEEDGRNRQPAKKHPLYRMLNFLPNPEMTSVEFRMTMMGHLALWGNAYAQIVYDRAGRRRELWPLRPDCMTVARNERNERIYRYQSSTAATELEWWEVMHLRGGSLDGATGYSPVATVRRAFELKLQMDEFATAFWQNDARPGVLLKYPKALSDKARNNILTSWEDRHKGPRKTNRPAILEEGLDVVSVGIPQNDAQFLESQKFTRTEIAAIFRVPPHMVGDLERATFSNIEEQAQEFIDDTLAPWIVIWQQAIERDLLDLKEQERYYAHFDVQALLRGKHVDRAQFYMTMQQIGAFSPNDIRILEDLNPIENGDIYLVPLNMQSVDDAASGEGTAADTPTAQPDAARAALDVLLGDVERRVWSRIANDVRQQGAKALRTSGRLGLSEWGETQMHGWRVAGEAMIEPIARAAAVGGLLGSEATVYGWVNMGDWVTTAYQQAVRSLIESKPGGTDGSQEQ